MIDTAPEVIAGHRTSPSELLGPSHSRRPGDTDDHQGCAVGLSARPPRPGSGVGATPGRHVDAVAEGVGARRVRPLCRTPGEPVGREVTSDGELTGAPTVLATTRHHSLRGPRLSASARIGTRRTSWISHVITS